MSASSGEHAPIPARMQPLVACVAAVLLLAAFTWLAASDRLVDHDAPPSVQPAFSTNVNTASAVELAQVPGVGPATAARIVDYREANGPFPTIDALLDVPGIGPATLEQMRPSLRAIRPPRREAP